MTEGTQRDFFREALGVLNNAHIPYMIGGAFAMTFYAGIHRNTKDLDVFIYPRDSRAVMDVFARAGYTTRVVSSHWLAKVTSGEAVVDFVFASRNGACVVDDAWFENAVDTIALGMPVKMVPVEEMIWSKGFVMARDRYDGADIAHLLRSKGRDMDWHRLLARFDDNWPVLFNHLLLFTFIYPSEAYVVPEWLKHELTKRWQQGRETEQALEPVCRGTLFSPEEYVIDIGQWDYADARLFPLGALTPQEAAQ